MSETCSADCEVAHERLELDWTFVKDELLFDRDKEVETLEERFRRRIAPDSLPEFVLLAGNAGTGKTALSRTLRHPVTSMGGYFLRAKFDQLQKPQPYSAFVTAFTKFVRVLIARGPNLTEEVRNAVLDAVGSDCRLLINMIPGLENILGPQESIVLKRLETRARLKIALGNFVRAICSLKRPLVLIMDDLQWADSESLELLEILVSDERIQGLVVVGVCRSDEVSLDHHFAAMLRRLEDESKTLITHIEVHDLTHKAIKTMLSFALNLSEEKCKLLAAFLFAQTDGNPFYVLQMLQEICYDGILVQDIQHNLMVWDESKLSYYKDKNVVDLLSRKIKRLPEDIQTVLMAAACLGAEFSCEILSRAMVNSEVEKALATAVNKNMVLYDARYDTYVFRHDKIQQAAYSLIDESERALVHVSIGRQLRKTLSEDQLASNAFLVINQMMEGAFLLLDEKEKLDLAHFCLESGRKAVLSSDFKTGAILFWHGINVCGEDCWRKDKYDLCLELYNAVTEAECINANFQQMNKAVEAVLSNALAFIDKIQVYSTQMYSLFARHRVQEAIDLGLYVLDCLGETFPSKIKDKAIIHADLEKARTLLQGKTDDEILKIPDIENEEKLAAMSLLNLLVIYTFVGRSSMHTFIATRFVVLSLSYGLSAYSAYGFCAYGIVCCIVGDWENGYRYGKLALSILDRYSESYMEWIPRVYSSFYGLIAPFQLPIRSVLSRLLQAENTGLKTGDFESAGFAGNFYCMNAIFAGNALCDIKEKLDLLIERFTEYKQPVHVSSASFELQVIRNFMGKSDNPLILDGEAFSEKIELEVATSQNKVVYIHRYWIRKMMLAYHFDDMELALDSAKQAQQLENSPNFLMYKIESYFYSGLVHLAAARATNLKEHSSEALKKLNKLTFLSDSCPNNCMHKVLLLEAEFASLCVKRVEAEVTLLPKYNNAMELARNEGFVHDQALICERTGWALRHHGKETGAVQHFKKAIGLYKQWGAEAKVDHMLRNCGGVQSM